MYVTTNEPIAFEHWGYANGFGAQPNNRNGNENCVEFVSSSFTNWEGPEDAWNDRDCSSSYNRFICEKLIE